MARCDGSGDADASSDEAILQILAVIAFIGIVFLSLSIRKDRLENKSLAFVDTKEDE